MGKYEDFNKVKLAQLLDDPEAHAVLVEHLGDLINLPMVKLAKQSRMTTVFNMAKSKITDKQIAAIQAALREL